jgi:hypothetical protein
MNQDNTDIYVKQLKRLNDEFLALPFPRIAEEMGDLDDLVSDVQIELADGDGAITGLVHRYIKRGNLGGLDILVKRSINSRIDSAIKTIEARQKVLQEFKVYIQKLLELADELSKISGVPIRELKR